MIYTLDAGGERPGVMAPNQPGTLESVVVLDGELELRLDGAPQRLAAGARAWGTAYTRPSTPTLVLTPACRFLVLVDTSRC